MIRRCILKTIVWKNMRRGDYFKISILMTKMNWKLNLRKCFWRKSSDFWNITTGKKTSRIFCFSREILNSWTKSINSITPHFNRRNDVNSRLHVSVLQERNSIPFWLKFPWERACPWVMTCAEATAQTVWSLVLKVRYLNEYYASLQLTLCSDNSTETLDWVLSIDVQAAIWLEPC